MDELIKKTAAELQAAYVDLKSIKGFAGAKAAAPRIVAWVNELKKLKGLSGEQAKELAVGLTLELIPLPAFFKKLPAFLQKWILGKIVESAYQAFKQLEKKLKP